MPFVLTGRGRITDSFPQCPLSPGLLGICSSETKFRNLIAEIRVISQISANSFAFLLHSTVGPWELLLSLSGSQLLFGPCFLVPISPFPPVLRRPLFLLMFLVFGAPQSLLSMAINLILMC